MYRYLLSIPGILLVGACGGATTEQVVAQAVGDPLGAHVQAVYQRGDHICGEVNYRGSDGRYRGYTRFLMLQNADHVDVAPPPRLAAPVERNDAACAQREAYKTAFERFQCGELPESSPRDPDPGGFESRWRSQCN